MLALLLVTATLGYLRDPPWLTGMTSGLRNWERSNDGTLFRWAGAHASFFVPSGAHAIDIPLRTTFDDPADQPIVITVTLDDRPVDRVVLQDAAWRHSLIRLPKPGNRRVRRVDIRADRTRDDNHAVQVGEIRESGSD
jgi:hypothetical protein